MGEWTRGRDSSWPPSGSIVGALDIQTPSRAEHGPGRRSLFERRKNVRGRHGTGAEGGGDHGHATDLFEVRIDPDGVRLGQGDELPGVFLAPAERARKGR